MSIINMLADLKTEINDLRQLEHLIQTDDFREAFNDPRNVVELEYHVRLRDVEAIKRFLRNRRPLEERTVKELRGIAARLRVTDYHLLSKSQLIGEIQRCQMSEVKLQASKSYMSL
jgi:hypothetical protein